MKHAPGRIIVKADIEGKNWHTFTHGVKIRIERGFNNLDRKHTEQVLGEVISAENIPAESMILFHHNSIHPVNIISNHTKLSGQEIASGIRYFSFREDECYAWKKYGSSEWQPLDGFGLCKYVYKPYNGPLQGIPPKKIKDLLYIAAGGEYAGKVCNCLPYSGMPIIFVNEHGVEETLVRLRTYNTYSGREEIAAVNEEYTEMLYNGELLIGNSESDCKPLNTQNESFK